MNGETERSCVGLREHRNQIQAAVQSASSSGDTVAQQLLSKIDRALSFTEKDNIPTSKFSALLELLSDAYKYSCSVTQDWFSLHGASVRALDNSDAAFNRFLSRRKTKDEDQAKVELMSCEQFAEEAAREAEADYDVLKKRVEEEESLATLDELEQIHTKAKKMVLHDKQALTEDRDDFSSDVDRIDNLLSDLVVVMDQSDVEYAVMMKELKTEMFGIRCHQERLGEHLWWLKKKEEELWEFEMNSPVTEENSTRCELEKELWSNHSHQEKLKEQLQELEKRLRVVEATASVEEFLQDKADEEYRCRVEEFNQWREELDSLHQQAETSLVIVDIMSECVQLIMEDTKMKKRDWQQQLHDMKLRNLLQLRDSLMAIASIHMMGVDNCEVSSEEAGDQSISCSDHVTSTKQQDPQQQQQHTQEQCQHEEKVKKLKAELLATDGEILELNPKLILDTLEDRYEKRRRVYDQNDNSMAKFCSHGNYSEKQGTCKRKNVGKSVQQKKRRMRGNVGTSSTKQQRPSQTGKQSESSHCHAMEKPYHFDYCQKRFTRRTLPMHILSHTGEKPHKCDYCQKRFSQSHNLRKHILLHTGEKPHKCEYCQKSFTVYCNLQTHILTHTGEKPHQCEYCQKKFTQRGHLRRHIRTHTGEKPYQCNYCQKRFAQLWSLRTHIVVHTREKPYQCDYCQKRFTQRSYLQKHIRIHTGEKPHQCEYCQKRFAQRGNLRAHILTHTGEKPHQCDYCQKRFAQLSTLRTHILIHARKRAHQSH